MLYIVGNIPVDVLGDERYADLTMREAERGYRLLGGDKGDLMFYGFYNEGDRSVVCDAKVRTGLDLTEDEAMEVAQEILQQAIDSIGAEALYHS